jgi:exosortase A-associated hydrolase 1
MTNLPQPKPQVLPIQLSGLHSLGIFVAGSSEVAILMVSGGAQTRPGSHRMQQQLASFLQQQQISSLRFDFPGYGDAEGQPTDFIQHAKWLSEVLATAQQAQPQIKQWVLFGLCDGASAILLNQQVLSQAAGLILLNPWCRAAHNHARTMVRFYYWQRLCSSEFWLKLLRGHSKPLHSLQQFFQFWRQARITDHRKSNAQQAKADTSQLTTAQFLPALIHNWSQYQKPVLLALSDNDLTAQECASLLADLPKRQRQNIDAHTTTESISGANHTCSDAKHLLQLQHLLLDWLRQQFPS